MDVTTIVEPVAPDHRIDQCCDAARIVTFDVLIISMVHRTKTLRELLDTLAPQLREGVRVLIYRHNLQRPSGEGRQLLLEASQADYVAFVDDDDMVSSNYVERIHTAIQSCPDIVNFRMHWQYNSIPHPDIDMSLKYGEHLNPPSWLDERGRMLEIGSCYDFMTWSAIRRPLALLAGYEGDAYRLPNLDTADDKRYCNRLRALDVVKTEVYIPEPLYTLRQAEYDAGYTPREPLTRIPPRPVYPGVIYLGDDDL